jgi:hypothetical protein
MVANAEFIAHARTDVPAMAAEIRRLRAELADFSGRVNELESRLCNCTPVREHNDYRRPAFYQHEEHCLVSEMAASLARDGFGADEIADMLRKPDETQPETGTRQCGHDDYHDAHEWADRPGVWCPGISYADDAPAAARP